MNSKERVLATLKRQPVDRTPIDCWLYQKQFVEKLTAAYGPREKFLDEFNVDIFVGFTPWPNQTGRLLDVSELPEFDPGARGNGHNHGFAHGARDGHDERG